MPVPYADLGDPQSLNLYGYVRNIPTTRFDADGHQDKKDEKKDDCGWWCRTTQRWHNSNNRLGLRTNAEVEMTAKHMREAATPELAYQTPETGTLTIYTGDQLAKMSDADAVMLWDKLFPGQDGDEPAQGIGSSLFFEPYGPHGFERPVSSEKGLQKIVNTLYQDTDTIPGGTAGAVGQEVATRQQVGGRWHSQKAQDKINELSDFLKDHQGMSSYDQNLLKALIQDLSNALAGKP